MPGEAETEMAEPAYSIPLSNLFLRDEGDDKERHDRLMYHLASGDYFNMLATALGFLEESLKQHCVENPDLEAREIKLARELRADLRYLNENYRIAPKDQSN